LLYIPFQKRHADAVTAHSNSIFYCIYIQLQIRLERFVFIRVILTLDLYPDKIQPMNSTAISIQSNPTYTAFTGTRRIASGTLRVVAAAMRAMQPQQHDPAPLLFRDDTGEQVDIDLRDGVVEASAEHQSEIAEAKEILAEKAGTKSRGRPKLGVIPREVTLLPEHWDWLSAQPGGASVALRKLVHEARKAGAEREQQRRAQERAYRVMSALAGNFSGFEEASRALFAGNLDRLAEEAQTWPPDVREYVLRLADPANSAGTGER
jgi:hypothetical protein